MPVSRIVLFIVLLPALIGLRPAWSEPRSVMTISGGVSLGVYEAGLGWAFTELLRQRAASGEGAPLTAVTGASAGSINALVAAISYCMADAQRQDVKDNLFRNIWLPIGLESLLPADSRAYDQLEGYRDGVLTRDPLRQAIVSIERALAKAEFRADCKIRLGLVVTRNRAERYQVESIDVRSQRFIIPLQAEVRDGRLQFGNFIDFAERERTPHLLLHARTDGSVDAGDVIRAALASSAFPIAFGRVRLRHCAEQPGAPGSAFCPAGYASASTTFVDGGVFDNVPLGAAMLLGEAEAPASAQDRYEYVYIDPDFRRAALGGRETEVGVIPGETIIPETDHYGLLDQTAFVLDALVIAHRNELYSTLRSNEWGDHRDILLADRYAPLTADYLRHFGAFIDPQFRRFDYYVGVYDAVINVARKRCERERPGSDACLHEMARELFERLQLQQDAPARTVFLALARHEFCAGQGCLAYGWAWLERLPPRGDTVLGQIFELLVQPSTDAAAGAAGFGRILTPPAYVEFLRRLRPLRERFEPALQRMIDHPERWYHAYLRRSALRLKALEAQKQAALSPEDQALNAPFVALTGLLNFGVHTLAPEVATEAWPVSSAPPGYAWYLPDEVAIDGSQTGTVFTWRGYLRPLAGPLYLEWEFAPLHWVRDREDRANFTHAGVNLRWRRSALSLSSLGIGGGAFFNWSPRDELDNQGLLINLNAGLLADKLRLGLGYKIIDSEAGDERLLFTIGISDWKGWMYWF